MNFFQAIKSMKNGIPVQSLVSKSIYEVNKEGFLCEGLPVSYEHLTELEANGHFQEVYIVETTEDFNKLTADEKDKILHEGFEHYQFNEKYRS